MSNLYSSVGTRKGCFLNCGLQKITIDPAVLERIDKLAADIGVSRTSVIEQAVINDLPEQESFYKSLENPVIRAMHEKLTSPKVMRMLAKLAQSDMSDEEIMKIVDKGPRQREVAKARRAEKKQKKANGEGAANVS